MYIMQILLYVYKHFVINNGLKKFYQHHQDSP